ncbi:Complex 1 LYR protein [Penicillium expansum]|uniref:Complex 1 LYR protein n=1 Tax=Penicillium expansum TaxID=27334 RepID=A0A0A2I7R5_PENEN|nr:Complex 1 LYR protein [Penicillium expansum]KGO39102.1 Complex 1 LYR protein [Penicillium expansum]KGO40551.1 Complex 1 LYR protein [Penicillium expansum]KGO49424.1 Complex 1 LYR protein [Penicillium expansum]
MARLSGLQRDVLSLYRKCLREIRNKPEVGYITSSQMGYSAEFQKHLSVNKKDFSTVEYLLRKGHRQLELYSTPGIRNIR